MTDTNDIRNFCIIAHIDHGKSTLADRILEHTGAFSNREMQDQVLDQMDLERERGITIKLMPVQFTYSGPDGKKYCYNLIDTPGHVDFSYEVSRSLAACEGALLVVDASQGIEAQTLANAYLALEHDLTLIPVINKMDLPAANPDLVKKELVDVLGLGPDSAILCSAKTGEGVPEILEAIALRISPPKGKKTDPLAALIFDSKFDLYRGVIAYIRVMQGSIEAGQKIKCWASDKEYEVDEVGVFGRNMVPVSELGPGDVGYLVAGIKDIHDARVGDTITDPDHSVSKPLPGYRHLRPMVFCGLYPQETNDYHQLRESLEKLQLNDAALAFEPETSAALGFGFRCGFLGLLHMEIVQERLEREFGVHIIATAPNVGYEVTKTGGEVLVMDSPAKLPPPTEIESLAEPFVRATIVVPDDYIGAVMELAQEKRGQYHNMEYLDVSRVLITYDLPLSEIVFDFFDLLKSRTRGYASLDYEYLAHRPGNLVKLDILINGEPVDALSIIVHRERAQQQGRRLVEKLRSLIPRQLFNVPIQAAIGNQIIARETVQALRKDVLAKCYGGDVTRKRKLLERQKEGKKRMKQVGNVEIPQEAFMAVLKVD
ncbi:MAG TPA: translation elongation factor 4 [bacterium]|nr:translation elongation factor 4 [bacterium]